MTPWSQPARALAAGGACLLVLAVMMVQHAWPLWMGQVVTVAVTVSASSDPFRGERLLVAPQGARVVVGNPASTAPAKDSLVVPPVGEWWTRVPTDARGRRQAVLSRVVYLQLEPDTQGSEYKPVSIGTAPVRDKINLRGRVRRVDRAGTLEIDYGIDSYYMQEGQAVQISRALESGAHVQMQIAIARSGRARIKSITVDGKAI